MYLSRCEINPNKRGARMLMSSPQRMHAAVLSCFPRSLASVNGRVLWRIDRTNSGTFLYITSKIKPDLTVIQEQAGWHDDRTALSRTYDPLLDGLRDGQIFHFRLTANPVKQEFLRGRRGRLIGHKTERHQIQWLLDRAEQNGFTIVLRDDQTEEADPVVAVVRNSELSFFKGSNVRRKVTLRVVTYEGILKVTNASLLRKSLIEGIGRAKAYGCGLITLSPMPEVEYR